MPMLKTNLSDHGTFPLILQHRGRCFGGNEERVQEEGNSDQYKVLVIDAFVRSESLTMAFLQ